MSPPNLSPWRIRLLTWSPVTESNRRPSPYHGDALPTELTGPVATADGDELTVLLPCRCLPARSTAPPRPQCPQPPSLRSLPVWSAGIWSAISDSLCRGFGEGTREQADDRAVTGKG